MKIGGREVTKPAIEILVLPRGENPDDGIVFKATAVEDMEEFEVLCPKPKAPGKLVKNAWVPNEDDESYRQMLETWSKRHLAFMVIVSLEPSEIEWSKVKRDDPGTWLEWDKELKEAGLTQIEVNRVIQLVLEANCLNDAKLDAALQAFRHGHQEE